MGWPTGRTSPALCSIKNMATPDVGRGDQLLQPNDERAYRPIVGSSMQIGRGKIRGDSLARFLWPGAVAKIAKCLKATVQTNAQTPVRARGLRWRER